jgi:hypothetical protein
VANSDNNHYQSHILKFAEDPVIAYTISPEFSELLAYEGLANTLGVFDTGQTLEDKSQYPVRMLVVKLVEIPFGAGRHLNLPCHNAS